MCDVNMVLRVGAPHVKRGRRARRARHAEGAKEFLRQVEIWRLP